MIHAGTGLDHVRQGNRNAAIGGIADLEVVLAEGTALQAAARALHCQLRSGLRQPLPARPAGLGLVAAPRSSRRASPGSVAMAKLSDTQLLILSAAAQREDCASVLPEKLKGRAAQKVVDTLLGRNLVTEVVRVGEMPVWRTEEDGVRYALRTTAQGLSEIGIEPELSDPPATPLK